MPQIFKMPSYYHCYKMTESDILNTSFKQLHLISLLLKFLTPPFWLFSGLRYYWIPDLNLLCDNFNSREQLLK